MKRYLTNLRGHGVIVMLVLAVPASLHSIYGSCFMAYAQEAEPSGEDPYATGSSPSLTEDNDGSFSTKAKSPTADKFNVKEHMDWGSYYDPKNVFCGQYDCYRILGFDYESFGAEKPDTKIITKRYRALSREWHPDKSKHKNAKERFVKIARAYEVLTDATSRKEYDEMRYNQEAYFQKYGTNVLWQYAPKSDTIIVVIFILLFVNGFGWFAQYQRWKSVADRLVRAAVEDWSPAQGGSNESKDLREHALEILAQRERDEAGTDDTTTTQKSSKSSKSSGKSNKASKLTAKEKKQKQTDDLKPIIEELAYDIDDFGAGFHKPTWRDLIILKLAKFPYHMARVSFWQTKYWARRLQKLPLTEDEKAVLTERAVGHVAWEIASEEEQKEMMSRELWILDNLAEYKDEQEFKRLSKGEQKYYKKMMKRKESRGSDLKED
ncbi:chaperone protein DnaJ [Nitzschia inconspicua]|uniref:Chaperone protein DnaJ n=1 Tax=Nitzschia inconspicua TaxID=303405 RepID=A0A9K3Q7P1_9STRA|nr:chaperone protein DnaJ [Nitzschia inconspicua]